MYRSGWLVGLCVLEMAFMTGCGGIPGLSSGTPQAGFSHVVTAPEGYRGTSAVTMRFIMPRQGAYSVAALSSDIERIDVSLTELGTIAVPPGIPLPMPASMPGSTPVVMPAPATPPQSGPTKGRPMPPIPAPAPAPLPSDMEQWPTILPDDPPQGGSTVDPAPSIPVPPPPRLEKPLYQPPAVVAKASVSRGDLDQGAGDVVFNSLKAGVYGIELQAVDRNGEVIGKSMQSVTVLDGQTTAVNTQLVLTGPNQGGNVAVGVTIVESGPAAGGSGATGTATASPAIAIALPLKR
ncbi:MAG TPA: hypothetical protein V6D05_00970 [Stenomitos sp.]